MSISKLCDDHEMLCISEACDLLDQLTEDNQKGKHKEVNAIIKEMINPISSTLEKSVKRQFEIFVSNTDSDSSEEQLIESNDYFIYVMHENVICFDEILINRVIDFEPIA
ncbi:hypothetical protein ACTOJ1_001263 [Shigella flexneri]